MTKWPTAHVFCLRYVVHKHKHLCVWTDSPSCCYGYQRCVPSGSSVWSTCSSSSWSGTRPLTPSSWRCSKPHIKWHNNSDPDPLLRPSKPPHTHHPVALHRAQGLLTKSISSERQITWRLWKEPITSSPIHPPTPCDVFHNMESVVLMGLFYTL